MVCKTSISRHKKTTHWYQCPGWSKKTCSCKPVKAEILECAAFENLEQIAANHKRLDSWLAKARDSDEGPGVSEQASEVSRLESKAQNLQTAIENGAVELGSRYSEVWEDIKKARERLDHLRRLYQNPVPTRDQFLRSLAAVREKIRDLATDQDTRELLREGLRMALRMVLGSVRVDSNGKTGSAEMSFLARPADVEPYRKVAVVGSVSQSECCGGWI